MSVTPARKLKIGFLHPDQGIGGAERLVVDAALSLQRAGHEVHLYTSHHSKDHCFSETRDGTQDVRVYGDFLPSSIFKKGHILCSIARNIYAATRILLNWPFESYDVMFIDQISVSVPMFLSVNTRVFFYCHFPDLLLAKHDSLQRKLYRFPFDLVEQVTTGCSDFIVVNSNFTKKTFLETFPLLEVCKIQPEVLYPTINFSAYQDNIAYDADKKACPVVDAALENLALEFSIFVSINRYEAKKNIPLAVKAFHLAAISKSKLIIAGGYDSKVEENHKVYTELLGLCASLGLQSSNYPDVSGDVVFLRSFTDAQRIALQRVCTCVVYTPENEHFGIVPVEAMYCGRPVIACNSGGPLETVIHDETGYLCSPSSSSFAEAMQQAVKRARSMSSTCRTHIIDKFSTATFDKQLHHYMQHEIFHNIHYINTLRTVTRALLVLCIVYLLYIIL